MKKTVKTFFCLIPIIILVMIICLTDNPLTRNYKPETDGQTIHNSNKSTVESINEPSEESTQKEITELNTDASYNHNNELVFSFSIDDFISAFNSCYSEEHGKTLLKPAAEWVSFAYDEPPYSDFPAVYYRFQQDIKKLQ